MNDAYEPNDTRAAATPMIVGTPLRGSFLTGYSSTSTIADGDWDDWYKVTLNAGTATITLSNVAPDINGDVGFYDVNGAELDRQYVTTDGANVVVSHTDPLAAGVYYVRVRAFNTPEPRTSRSRTR